MTEPTEVPGATGLAILDQIQAGRRGLKSKLARLDAQLAKCNSKQRREFRNELSDWVVAYANGQDIVKFLDQIDPQGETA